LRPDAAVAAMAVAVMAEVGTVAAAATAVALILAAADMAAVDILVVVVVAAVAHDLPEVAGIPAATQPSRIQAAAERRPSRVRPAAAVSAAIAPVRTITLQETEQARTAARQISAPTPFIMRSPRAPWPARCITTTP
jgi:hypothetical protein